MRLLAALAIAALLTGCERKPDVWTGWVYPAGNLLVTHKVGTFPTFEQCRVAAWEELRRLGPQDGDAFECGLNCSDDPARLVQVCDETRD